MGFSSDFEKYLPVTPSSALEEANLTTCSAASSGLEMNRFRSRLNQRGYSRKTSVATTPGWTQFAEISDSESLAASIRVNITNSSFESA